MRTAKEIIAKVPPAPLRPAQRLSACESIFADMHREQRIASDARMFEPIGANGVPIPQSPSPESLAALERGDLAAWLTADPMPAPQPEGVALDRMRDLGIVPKDPEHDPVEMVVNEYGEEEPVWIGGPRLTDEQSVYAAFGAAEARVRAIAAAPVRGQEQTTRAMIKKLDLSGQYPEWRQRPLTESLLTSMQRYLKLCGYNPPPNLAALRKQLARAKKPRKA